jgi:hypothetical protein
VENFEIRVVNKQDDSAKLHKSLIEGLERKLEKLKEQELLQWKAQTDPDPAKRMPAEIFKTLNENLRKEKADLEDALSEAYESLPEPIDYNEKIVQFTEALDKVNDPNVSIEIKNQYLKNIIERIDYKRPANVRLTKENAKEYGIEKLSKGNSWYIHPFEIEVHLR